MRRMKWISRRKRPKLAAIDAARFSWALDTDRALQSGIAKLAERFGDISETEYTARMLKLFSKAGLELTKEELKTLLAFRRQTDQMLLLEKKEDDVYKVCQSDFLL